MPSRLWDEITYQFQNFNGCTVEVWEWISDFTPALYNGCNHVIPGIGERLSLPSSSTWISKLEQFKCRQTEWLETQIRQISASVLIHWGLNIMAAILQNTFSSSLFWMKLVNCSLIKCHWHSVLIDNKPTLVQVIAWWQAIIWTSYDTIHWCTTGHNVIVIVIVFKCGVHIRCVKGCHFYFHIFTRRW